MENVPDMLEKKRKEAEEAYTKRMAFINNVATQLFNSMVDGETVNVKILLQKDIFVPGKPIYGMLSIHKSMVFNEMKQTPKT